MSADIGWQFPLDLAGQWQGFNDPGIEHFRGNPFGGLAREIIQNSLDAPHGSPVTISFELRQIPTNEIPDIEDLKSTVESCSRADGNEVRKAKEFFAIAKKVLSNKTIPVLTIIEHNTAGMRGPCKIGTPYFAYMKATGQSKKESEEDDIELGSYGIGKFAPFAVSNLRTVIISTVFQEKEKGNFKQYTQGKAILTSHFDEKRKTHQNIGYWGLKTDCMPVEGHSGLPKWLQRSPKAADLEKNRGTTFHVLGFDAQENWEKILIASVLENFFGAIWRSKLSVKVGSDTINKATINKHFERNDLVEALNDMKGEPESFHNARQYLRALVGTEEVFTESQENRELGNCEVRIMIGTDFPKRVAALRSGMFITDRMDGLSRFGDFKEFVAVVECLSKKGNMLLRDMEPPKHNDFEPERLTQSDRAKGKRALNELAKWVREMLKRHARDPVSDISEVRELADYFADDADQDDAGGKGEEVNPIGAIQVRAQPLKRRPVTIRQEGEEGGGDGDRDSDDNDNGGGGGGNGGWRWPFGQRGGRKAKSSPSTIELLNVRSVVLSPKSRRLAFTPTFSGNMELQIYEAGADTDRQLKVIRSNQGKVRDGLVRLPAKDGVRTTIELGLEADFLGAMKVAAHAV